MRREEARVGSEKGSDILGCTQQVMLAVVCWLDGIGHVEQWVTQKMSTGHG